MQKLHSYLLFLAIPFTLSSCSAVDAVRVASTSGDYRTIYSKNGIVIEQRYEGAYDSLDNPVSAIFGSVDRSNARVKHVYRLKSFTSSHFDEFEATFSYWCEYESKAAEYKFKSSMVGKEIDGLITFHSSCSKRPTSSFITISEKPFEGYLDQSSGVRSVGTFSRGRLKTGMIIKPEGTIETVSYDQNNKLTGSFKKLYADGRFASGNYESGLVEGLYFSSDDNDNVKVNFYEKGLNETENFISNKSREIVRESEADAIKKISLPFDNKLQRVQEERRRLLSDSKLAEIHKLYSDNAGRCKCALPGALCLLAYDSNETAHEQERRERKFRARQRACTAMVQMGIPISNDVNIDQFIRNFDLSDSRLSETSAQSIFLAKKELLRADNLYSEEMALVNQKKIAVENEKVKQEKARESLRQIAKQKLRDEQAKVAELKKQNMISWRTCIKEEFGLDPDTWRSWTVMPQC